MIESDYVEISVEILKRQAKSLLFDVYVKRADTKFTKIFKKSEPLDLERLKLYTSKGVDSFFVAKDDFERYVHFVDLLVKKYSKDNGLLKSKDGLDVFSEMISLTTREMIVLGEVNSRVVSNANLAVQNCVDSLTKGGNNKTLMRIVSLMSGHEYQIKHSIMVSIFSIVIAKDIGIVSESGLMHVGLGGFLHDIGISQVSVDPEMKEFLTAEELKEVRRHPELGKRLLDGMKGVRQEVIDIVLQHHEQPNGTGYPNGRRGPEIYHLAKIVSIADAFSALISKRPYRDAFTPRRAVMVMKGDVGRFDAKIMRSFEKLFNKSK